MPSGDGRHARDFPGTPGLRRSVLLDAGGYDGDCLFENLGLIRTVEAAGGTVVSPVDLYVRRLPPTARHLWSQRVRQAYDDFAIPARYAGAVLSKAANSCRELRRRLGDRPPQRWRPAARERP